MKLVRLTLAGLLAGTLVVAAYVAIGTSSDRLAQAGRAEAPQSIVYPAGLQDLPAQVTRFAIDPSGTVLWFPAISTTGHNVLYRYDIASAQRTEFVLPNDPGGGFFVGIAATADAIWVGWDKTLVRFDKTSAKIDRYAVPASANPLPGSSRWVRDVAVTSDGRVWLSEQEASSLFSFDPKSATFAEHPLVGFGAADRITVGPSDVLWLTLARDAVSQKELGKIARYDPRSDASFSILEAASAVAVDTNGAAVLAGNPHGISRLDASGALIKRAGSSHGALASDLIATLSGGRVAITNRLTNSLDTFDPATFQWTSHRLTTVTGTIAPPAGYTGPTEKEVVNEVTDIHVDSSGAVWLVIPNYARFAKLTP